MENKIEKKEKKQEEVSRKEAIKKVGTYTALTAATMMFLLNAPKAAAASPDNPPAVGDGW